MLILGLERPVRISHEFLFILCIPLLFIIIDVIHIVKFNTKLSDLFLFMRVAVVLMVTYLLVKLGEFKVDEFSPLILTPFLLTFLVYVYQYFVITPNFDINFRPFIGGNWDRSSFRYVSFAGDPNVTGLMLGWLFIIFFKKKYWTVALLCLLLLFFTFSRLSIVALLIATLATVNNNNRVLLFFLGTPIYVYLLANLPRFSWENLLHDTRISMLMEAPKLIETNIFFGVGFGTIEQSFGILTHNSFLDILVGYGVPLFILTIGVIAYLHYFSARNVRKRESLFLLISAGGLSISSTPFFIMLLTLTYLDDSRTVAK